MSEDVGTKHQQLGTKRKLTLVEAIAISVGFMAPLLAMSLNGIGIANTVGAAVPLVFVIGTVGVLAVAYGFIRLTGYFRSVGSIYGLVGETVGPRAGFFGGWALIGTYMFFAACTLGACAVFFGAFLQQFGISELPLPWIIVSLIAGIGVLLLNLRESAIVARVLSVIGGVGIAAMLILAVVIFVRIASGTAPLFSPTVVDENGVEQVLTQTTPQTFDFISTFSFGDNSFTVVMAASVWAFLSWAGFESCASLGEETANPKRNIPRALLGAVLLGGVLYVFMMFAQTIGFGTDEVGVAAFQVSQSTMTDLGTAYIGEWFSMIVGFAAFCVAFASTLSSTAAASRLLFSMGRDGFAHRGLAKVSKHDVPHVSVITILVIVSLLCIGLAVFGINEFDVYYWYATIATLCMVVAYGMASIGVIIFTVRGKLSHIPKWELIIPLAGLAYLVIVFVNQFLGQPWPYQLFPFLAAAWCLIGAVIILVAPGLAQRIGARITEEDPLAE